MSFTEVSKDFVVVNVVATAEVGQPVELSKLNGWPWGRYDPNLYPAGYVKDVCMMGKVTVFRTGRLIGVGTRLTDRSFWELDHVVELLTSVGLIPDDTT